MVLKFAKFISMENNNSLNKMPSNNSASKQSPLNGDNTIKDPNEWKTGDEPITGAQRSYLNTLADEAGEEINENLTKAEASKKIDELQQKTGRGLDH